MEIKNNKLSFNDKLNNLITFLNDNRSTDIKKSTHVSIGDNYICGSFNLDNKFDEFKELYINVIKDKKYKTISPLNILEVPYEGDYYEKFKFDIDIKIKDVHYNDIKNITGSNRLYNNNIIEKINLLISDVIYEYIEHCRVIDIKEYNFIIFEKDDIRYNKETNEYKDGFHIVIDNLYIRTCAMEHLYKIIVDKLKYSDIFIYLPDEYLDINKLFDNVIKKNWLLYGSSKPNEKLYYKATKEIIYTYSETDKSIIKLSEDDLTNCYESELYDVYSLFQNKLYSYKIKGFGTIYDLDGNEYKGYYIKEEILKKFKREFLIYNTDYENISKLLKYNLKKYNNIIDTGAYYCFKYKIFNNIYSSEDDDLSKKIIKTINTDIDNNNEDEYIDEETDNNNDTFDNDMFDNILSLLPDNYFSQNYNEWFKLVSFTNSNNLDINILDTHSKRGNNYNKINNKKYYKQIKGCNLFTNNFGWLYNQLKIWNNEAFEKIKNERKEKLRIRYLPYKILKLIDNEPDLLNFIINDPKTPNIYFSNNYIFCYNETNCIWEIVKEENILFILQDIINNYKKMYENIANKKLQSFDDIDEMKDFNKEINKNLKLFDTTIKTRNLKSCVRRFLNHPKILNDNFYNLINKSKYELPIKNNKIINLKTKEIRQRTKTDYFTFYCDVEYNSNNNKYNDKIIDIDNKKISPNDLFYKFIDNFTLGDEDTKLYLQKILGYYISGETNANIFYVFCGGGANGKSTIFNLLFHLLNRTNKDNNIISLGEDVLIETKNGNRATQIKALQNARIGICQETPTGAKLNINLIKRITGGDDIRIEEKFATEMTKLSINTKLIISTNYKPEFDGESHANIRRFRYFNCDCRFVSRDTSNKNERKGIDGIEELLKKYCMNLFFSWIIDGAYNYFNSNDKKLEYDIPENIKKVQNEYINIMSSVKTWVDNKIIKTNNNKDNIKRSDTYKSYEIYCNDEIGITPLRKKEFFEKINNLLGEPIKSNGDIIFKNYKFNIERNNNNDLDD